MSQILTAPTLEINRDEIAKKIARVLSNYKSNPPVDKPRHKITTSNQWLEDISAHFPELADITWLKVIIKPDDFPKLTASNGNTYAFKHENAYLMCFDFYEHVKESLNILGDEITFVKIIFEVDKIPSIHVERAVTYTENFVEKLKTFTLSQEAKF